MLVGGGNFQRALELIVTARIGQFERRIRHLAGGAASVIGRVPACSAPQSSASSLATTISTLRANCATAALAAGINKRRPLSAHLSAALAPRESSALRRSATVGRALPVAAAAHPESARMPFAIGRSKRLPPFGRSASARLNVIRRFAN